MQKYNLDKIYNKAKNKVAVETPGLKELGKFSPALLMLAAVPADSQTVVGDYQCDSGANTPIQVGPPPIIPGSRSTSTGMFDIDGDGVADIYMRADEVSFSTGSYFGRVAMFPATAGVGIGVLSTNSSYAANASIGATVGAGQDFNTSFGANVYLQGTSAFGGIGGTFNGGQWAPPTSGYVPVQLSSGNFGWLEMTLNGRSDATITNWAFNTTGAAALVDPGVCVEEVVPTMGEWGLICLNLILMIFGVTAIKEQGKVKLQRKAS